MIIHEEYLPEGKVRGNKRLEQLHEEYEGYEVEVELDIVGYRVIVTKE